MCGEQISIFENSLHQIGSPPRVRGTAIPVAKRSAEYGITPACAGNRVPMATNTARSEDHPRVCGEQSKAAFSAARIWGSPPRVRGTASSHNRSASPSIITPACAGNSPPEWSEALDSKDHPRVCGEQLYNESYTYCDKDHPRVCGEQQCLTSLCRVS